MHIWVDADACPHVIKDLLYRAANRLEIALTLVANQPLRTPASPYITVLRVPAGFDRADQAIVRHVCAGDLVVTADIPLAAQVVAKGAYALNPRGQFYTPENIHEHLTMRHVMDELRQSGVQTGGPSPFSRRDRQAFANQLGPVIDTRGSDRIGRHRVSIEHAGHRSGRPNRGDGGALHPRERRIAVGAKNADRPPEHTSSSE